MKRSVIYWPIFVALALVIAACGSPWVIRIGAEDYNNIGVTHAERLEFEKAIDAYSFAIHYDPGYAVAYYNRGMAHYGLVYYFKRGSYDLAIADFSEALRLDPTMAEAFANRGLVYYDLGELEQAIIDFNEAIRIDDLDPNMSKVYNMRGLAYYDLGEFHQAIIDLNEAVRIDPKYTDAYINSSIAGCVANNLCKCQAVRMIRNGRYGVTQRGQTVRQ